MTLRMRLLVASITVAVVLATVVAIGTFHHAIASVFSEQHTCGGG
jgi:hypothetical protein